MEARARNYRRKQAHRVCFRQAKPYFEAEAASGARHPQNFVNDELRIPGRTIYWGCVSWKSTRPSQCQVWRRPLWWAAVIKERNESCLQNISRLPVSSNANRPMKWIRGSPSKSIHLLADGWGNGNSALNLPCWSAQSRSYHYYNCCTIWTNESIKNTKLSNHQR